MSRLDRNPCGIRLRSHEHMGSGRDRMLHRRKCPIFWDVPPRGFEHLTPMQYKALQPDGKLLQAKAIAELPTASIPYNDCGQWREARRLYVANVPNGATNNELRNFFNRVMCANGIALTEGKPVWKCHINAERHFAFLEFRCSEEATQALSLDFIYYKGQHMNLQRPHYYAAPSQGFVRIDPTTLAKCFITNSVPDSPHKLFLCNLPHSMNDREIIDLLMTVGVLKAFKRVRDSNTGVRTGYGFCEYKDPEHSTLAIQTFNGMVVSKRKIIVQKASYGRKQKESSPKDPADPKEL